ncbi:MAG: putative transposase [Arenicella sp.]|jgi:REP element-mobilizing transposase RayT
MNPERFYRANLPHLQPMGGTFFITYNLAGCIPKHLFQKWEAEYLEKCKLIRNRNINVREELNKLNKLEFAKRDNYLDAQCHQDFHLKNDNITQEVANSLHFWDGKRLELYAYCIMPNHVHVVFRLFDEEETRIPFFLQQAMKSIKNFSANKSNQLLNQQGQLWQSFHDGTKVSIGWFEMRLS